VVRGKRAMKERIRQALSVFDGYIEQEPQERLARTFCSFPLCSLHCSSCWFSDGSHSGILFCFCYFSLLVFLENNMLWLGGGSKGKTSVWDIETWPCVISNLD